MVVPTFPSTRPRPSARPASIAEVDAAVRSVLATRDGGPRSDGPRAEDGARVFAERLLALRHAEALADSVREVRVAPGTVITPMARDRLKSRGIAIRLVAWEDAARHRRPGEWGFVIEGPALSGMITSLRRTLLEGDWSERGGSLDDAVRWVAGERDRGALVVTDESSVAVWRACQVDGVRAASVADADAVARAIRCLGVNLIVVEPSGKSIFAMQQIGSTFRRAGAPVRPEGLDRDEEGRRCGSPR